MRSILVAFACLVAPVLMLASAAASSEDWDDTGAAASEESDDENQAFGFLFSNHIDTHLATRLVRGGSLRGSLYIIFTGDIDPVSGLPVARHPRGAMHSEECDFDVDCFVGWRVRAVRGEAKFVSHSGINGDDHPIWMVNRVDMPQPGAFSHFHWIGADSTDERALAGDVPAVCDVDMAGELEGRVVPGEIEASANSGGDGPGFTVDVHVGGGAEDTYCPGWFLQLRAVRSFAFRHGGEVVAVHPGIDLATHLNLVTNYAIVPVISPTRGAH